MNELQTADGAPIVVEHYPDGMPLIRHRERCETLVLRPKSLDTFTAAMFWCQAQRMRHAPVRTLILPCIPGARQDRMNATGDALFTLRSVADMLNDRGFGRVVVLDPHSEVAVQAIDSVTVVSAAAVSPHLGVSYAGVIAPDAGAVKRAQQMAYALNVPIYYAGKNREVATGVISGFWCDALPDGHYLVADDICDGGGTFHGLANVALRDGVTLDLYVSHGVFSRGAEALLKQYTRVFTTDSIIGAPDGVTVIPILPELLRVASL